MERLLSRKFLLTVASAALIAFGDNFGIQLDPEAIAGLVGAVAAFVFGEAQLDKAKINADLDAQKLQLNNYVIQLTELLKRYQAEVPAPEGEV